MTLILQCLFFLFVIVSSTTTSRRSGTSQSHSLEHTSSVSTHVSTYPKSSSLATHLSVSSTTSLRGSKLQSHSATSTTSLEASKIQSHSVTSATSLKESKVQSHSATSRTSLEASKIQSHSVTSTTSLKESKVQSYSVTSRTSLKGSKIQSHSVTSTTSLKGSTTQSHSVTSTASLKGSTIQSHSVTSINSLKGSKLQSHSVTSTTSLKESKIQSHSVTSLKGTTKSVSTKSVSVHPRSSTTTSHHSSSSATPGSKVTGGFNFPVAAAWLYMSDSTDYMNIPKWWNTMDFTKVDVLYVTPLGVQNDSRFGLFSSKQTGSIETRFRWAIQTARTHNPNIKIIASQFWGGNPGHFSIWGYDYLALKNSSAISKYAASVAAFMETWKSFYGGLDGYDVDFEDTNVTPKATEVLKEIRQKFSTLDRHYYITVSPSTNAYLQASKPYIDYVNMQTYAGGYYLTPRIFTDVGFSSKQLLYGICPEASCHTRNVTEVIKQYKNSHLAGVHLWRLDSTNHPHEQDWQNQVYKALHPT